METPGIYYLEIVKGNECGKRFILNYGENTIGRLAANSICLNTADRFVSKNHAIVIISPVGISIEDCTSTNGTFINGERISRKILKLGDEIGFGIAGPRLRLMSFVEDSVIEPASSKNPLPPHGDHSGTTSTDVSAASHAQPSGNEKDFLSLSDSESEEETTTRVIDKNSKPSSPQPEKPPSPGTFDASGILSLSESPLYPPQQTNKKEPQPIQENFASTMDIQSRIQKGTALTQDFKILFNDEKKYQKIMENEGIDASQRWMINKFHKAHHSGRKKMFLAFGGALIVLVMISSFFITGYVKRGAIINKGIALKQQLDIYEEKIEHARKTGGSESSEIRSMYAELQNKQMQLDSVKNLLDVKNQRRLFADTLEYFIDEIMVRFNEANYRIPPHMLQRIKYYIEINTGPRRRNVAAMLRRKDLFFPEIEKVFRRYNIPCELAYVSMQESGLDTLALSGKAARGLWQFIPETGVLYGLEINSVVDERTDWRKSTVAAAKYFHKLLTEYGKGNGVLLAIASYNAGAGCLRRALAAIENPLSDRDFWYLYRTSQILPDETREYIPQILALIIIDRHRGLYGFL